MHVVLGLELGSGDGLRALVTDASGDGVIAFAFDAVALFRREWAMGWGRFGVGALPWVAPGTSAAHVRVALFARGGAAARGAVVLVALGAVS